jgi:flagellar basal-body rod protein FlgG
MNLSLYSAATGMEAQQLNLSAISNNIANVNTTGFKKSKLEFQDLLYQDLRQPGAEVGNGNVRPSGVALGNGVEVVSTTRVFSQGELTETGKQTDVAIEGIGFFEVEKPDGSTAYTRDGAWKVDANGRVVTNEGFPIVGLSSLPSDTLDFTISANGQVTVRTPGGQQSFTVGMVRFPNPGGLRALGGNLYEQTPASGTAEAGNPGENGFGYLRQGFLEMSNVNVVQEMVDMISAQRAYEINSKAIQTSDDMLSRVVQLKR